jgi:hypothetical protein
MKKTVTIFVLTAVVVSVVELRAQIIDRILAVVDGAIIMQSDVMIATRLGLVPGAGASDPTAAVLERLIERQLILSEVDRYAPADPAEADVERNVADIRLRAGAQFDSILLAGGIGLDQLRRHVRDDLRIESYLQQRFGAVQPTEEEILQYYRDHAAAFTQNGVLRPFDDAHDAARAALIADRRVETIRDWVAGLRRRANINVLPR